MDLNKVYHMDNRVGLLNLPDKCANLIIADPPYFEVKGEFDFVWKSFDEYLEFMEQQAKLYKRILADNGTLIVWGSSKHIAYIQVVFDQDFNLINNAVWDKGAFMGLEQSDGLRSLAPSAGPNRFAIGRDGIRSASESLCD
jgi:DNA modification methylase